MDPTHRYEQLLVEAVNHAPTSVQQAVAAVLGHHGLACDSDHHSQEGEINDLHRQKNEATRELENQRRRADIAEQDAQYYKQRVEELEQVKSRTDAYAARLAQLQTKLINHARYMREQAAGLEDIAHNTGELLSNHGDQDRVR